MCETSTLAQPAKGHCSWAGLQTVRLRLSLPLYSLPGSVCLTLCCCAVLWWPWDTDMIAGGLCYSEAGGPGAYDGEHQAEPGAGGVSIQVGCVQWVAGRTWLGQGFVHCLGIRLPLVGLRHTGRCRSPSWGNIHCLTCACCSP